MCNGTFSEYEIAPEDYGLMRSRLENLQGAGISQNVKIIMGVLHGRPGAHRDIVLLNAGCALYAANKTGSIREGITLAAESIDSGNALRKLELLKEYSHGGA
jgi:anthranilate phosphoribosyltransferase